MTVLSVPIGANGPIVTDRWVGRRGHDGAMAELAAPAVGSWAGELTDLARAAAGGMLFGIPLLYTMEAWWTGSRSTPVQNLVVLGVAFAVVLLLQRTAGFRRARHARLRDAAVDAVEAVALSLVIVTIVLVLLREITAETPLEVGLGKIVHQALAFSIGAGVARQFLGESRDGGADSDEPDDGSRRTGTQLNATIADVGATAVGSTFVALNIAPTDEVPMLDTAMDTHWVLALLGASLAISYAIVFVAGFSGERQRKEQAGILQHPLTETLVCYLVSLLCALALLWIFHRAEGPWSLTFTRVIVLGLPAAVGGAAGRLAI